MEVEVSDPKPVVNMRRENSEKDRVRVKRKTLQTVLEQCQRALELLNTTNGVDDEEEGSEGDATVADGGRRLGGSPSMRADKEAEEVNIYVYIFFNVWLFFRLLFSN